MTKSIAVVVAVTAVFGWVLPASAQDPAKEALDELLAVSAPNVVVLSEVPGGFPGGVVGIELPALSADPLADARTWVNEYATAFGVQDPERELVFERVRHGTNRIFVHFSQVVGDIPVFRGGMEVVLRGDGTLRGLINYYAPLRDTLDETDAQMPVITAADALQQVYKDGAGLFQEIDADDAEQVTRLVYYAPAAMWPQLAIEVQPPGIHLALNYRVFYNAETGRLLGSFNDLWFENDANVFEPSPGRDEDRPTAVRPLRGRDNVDGLLTGPLVQARNCIDQDETLLIGPFEVPICSEIQVATADDAGDFVTIEPDFDADEDLFAEVHMYYHVNEIYDYAQQLGLETVDEVPLPATVNFRIPGAVTGSSEDLAPFDNAFFFPAGDILGVYNRDFDSIIFGQGTNVDFAYDGDVIYHEFGHAVFQAGNTPGQFIFDEQGMSAAPAALNEGWGDYLSGAFTEDPEIGEYVGPRIVAGTDSARNIRTMDNEDSCPTAISGEVHGDSTHFTGALWEIRSHWVTEMEGDPVAFDTAIHNAIQQFGPLVSFDRAVELVTLELGDLDADLPVVADASFANHNVADCQRIITLGGLLQGEDISFLYGPDAVALQPFVPGFVQFRVVVEEDDLPANTISVTLNYQGGADLFGTPARVAFAVSPDEPVSLNLEGDRIDGNWVEVVEVSGTGDTRTADYYVEDGLDAGEYYLMPVGIRGSSAVMYNIRSSVSQEEPQADVEPDTGASDDGAEEADAGDLPDVVGDAAADLTETGGDGSDTSTTGTTSNEDGCECSSSGSSAPPVGFIVCTAITVGILRRRRRL